MTRPRAFYNEHDPAAAAWLRQLIAEGHIAEGIVDERSIEDIAPAELAGFVQCHFFAGVGVWSYALRRAGWRDDRPVWTGSCPCQPFSTAGKGAGLADERHLWPAFFHLIDARRPGVVFGEQVASLDGLAWLDLVSADMEGADYALGPADLCAAGFGAPHIRQRLYFAGVSGWRGPDRLGHAGGAGLEGLAGDGDRTGGRPLAPRSTAPASLPRGLVDADTERLRETGGAVTGERPSRGCATRGLADPERGAAERHGFPLAGPAGGDQGEGDQRQRIRNDSGHGGDAGGMAAPDFPGGRAGRPGPTNGFWRAADWLLCRDPGTPRWRPVEPGTFPLADGPAAGVVRLRGYGNAINAEVAAGFIRTAVETFGLDPLGASLA